MVHIGRHPTLNITIWNTDRRLENTDRRLGNTNHGLGNTDICVCLVGLNDLFIIIILTSLDQDSIMCSAILSGMDTLGANPTN